MTKPRVLISDALSPAAVQIFKDRGIDVTFDPSLGKDKDKLAAMIGEYDGLAIRSATKATAKLLESATNLKVIGRAGIGVDNVEIPAATARGIIVMNTPFGNSITTAEHAIAMMMALARQIPEADASTQAGKWEKNRFMGVEMTAKTLGVIGCGNIGSIAADRAVGLKMRVIAYDPFLTPERAVKLGVEKVELDELLARADFITLHVPMTEKTKNILSRENLAKTKKGVRIINCARGGLVDEEALADLIKSGHVAGAAFDVFSVEPAETNPLFGLPNVICTPHLGASTNEAQENVALQVAEQMSDYLLRGAITNAVNFPSITAEEAPRVKPFVALAEKLGSFLGQLTESAVKGIRVVYEGKVRELNTKPMTAAPSRACSGRSSPRSTWSTPPRSPRTRASWWTRRTARRRRTARAASRSMSRRRTWCGMRPARCCPTGCRASPRSATSRWTRSSRRTWFMCATPTSRASSAPSARCWARRGSISRPSTSAATSRAGMRSAT